MKKRSSLTSLSLQKFAEFLKAENIRRFYMVYDLGNRIVLPSHPALQPIADFFQSDRRDFLEHEGAFFQYTERYDTLQSAFVHRTRRGQAAGGVRYWSYPTLENLIRDGLRLSKGMTRKNALAGLWWGGGKGVMAVNPAIDHCNPKIRAYLYSEYGSFVSSLQGCYVTAEDVGTSVDDMVHVYSRTRFTSCIPEAWGGSGNPSVPTARGVVCGMEAALEYSGKGSLEGKTVAIQGLGHVGNPLIGFLFEKGVKKILACDIFPEQVAWSLTEFSGSNLEARTVSPDDLSFYDVECDIFSPNATGAVLNPQTIPSLKGKIVCGAANNQLEDGERDDRLCLEHGVLYVPDFLTNRMGIVNAADEQYGYVDEDPKFERHLSRDWEYSIYQTTLRILDESRKTGDPTARIAIEMADRLSLEKHPIFGHRGRQIINSLVSGRWHLQ